MALLCLIIKEVLMKEEFSIYELEKMEYEKRDKELDFIASQNLCSEDILKLCSSITQMKYSEGFPHARYYEGCEVVDIIEAQCQQELLKLFRAEDEYLANVQPANGSSANMITYRALLSEGDTVLACGVDVGGHISHSHKLGFLSTYYNVVTYGLTDDGYIDYDQMEKLAKEHKPALIIIGMSNYSRTIDYERVREIADLVGAKVMADIAHISGLIATCNHPSPVGYADVITTTTHKILRGPRSAAIMYKKEYDKLFKRATIPGLFGGADQAKIFAKLLCFREAQTPQYKDYCKRVIKNAKAMVNMFNVYSIKVLTGGTDNHSFCIDLTDCDISGKELSSVLANQCGLITNCNAVPNDKRGFFQTSGVRFGTPSVTTRGLTESDCAIIAAGIGSYLNNRKEGSEDAAQSALDLLKENVQEMTKEYPLSTIYPEKYRALYN